MKHSVVVGFGYKARHGKDTCVAEIIKQRGDKYDIHRYAFADALKREANTAAANAGGMLELFKQGGVYDLGYPEMIKFPLWVKYDPNAPMDDLLCPLGKQRLLLQWWGTDYRRNQSPSYWVKRLEETIEKERPRIALISDVRFPNEVSWVKQDVNSGFAVRVDRLGYTSNTPPHESETALDWMGDEGWHYIIQCPDGDVEELKRDAVVVFDLIIELLSPPDLSEIEHFQNKTLRVETISNG